MASKTRWMLAPEQEPLDGKEFLAEMLLAGSGIRLDGDLTADQVGLADVVLTRAKARGRVYPVGPERFKVRIEPTPVPEVHRVDGQGRNRSASALFEVRKCKQPGGSDE